MLFYIFIQVYSGPCNLKVLSHRTPKSSFLRIQYLAMFLSHNYKHLIKNVYQILKDRLSWNNFISHQIANKWVLVPRGIGNSWIWMTLKWKYLLRRQTHWILKAGYTACFSVNGTCVFTQLEKQTSVRLLLSVWNTLYQ